MIIAITTTNRHYEDTDSHTPMHRERATVASGRDMNLCVSVCVCVGAVGLWIHGRASRTEKGREGQGREGQGTYC